MSKPCPVEHCDTDISDYSLMCKECWSLLSASQTRALNETFARYAGGSPAHEAASQSAIRAASAARKKFVE